MLGANTFIQDQILTITINSIPRDSSLGVDNQSVDQVKRNLSWLLPPELDKIHKKRYNPPPVKRVYIPKPQGGKRPIGIPTILDRGIQAATAEVLNQVYEVDFLPVSFGFGPESAVTTPYPRHKS